MIAKTKLLMVALIAAMGAVSPVIAAQPLTKVIMTTGSFSEREAAMYVAQDQGFFRRYGLELTFVQVRSGPVGMDTGTGKPQPLDDNARQRQIGNAQTIIATYCK